MRKHFGIKHVIKPIVKRIGKKNIERNLLEIHPRYTSLRLRAPPSCYSRFPEAPSRRQPSLPISVVLFPTQTTCFCWIFPTVCGASNNRQNDPHSRTTTIYLWPDISCTRRSPPSRSNLWPLKVQSVRSNDGPILWLFRQLISCRLMYTVHWNWGTLDARHLIKPSPGNAVIAYTGESSIDKQRSDGGTDRLLYLYRSNTK